MSRKITPFAFLKKIDLLHHRQDRFAPHDAPLRKVDIADLLD